MRNPKLTPNAEQELRFARDERSLQRESGVGISETISLHGKHEPFRSPYLKYQLAAKRLEKMKPGLECEFGPDGYIRTLSAPSDEGGLYNSAMAAGGPREQARNCLFSLGIREILPLDLVYLRFAGIEETPFGFMVKLRQVATVTNANGRTHPEWYLGGNAALQVHMTKEGAVFKIDSTLALGPRPRTLVGLIGEAKAVEIARLTFGSKCEQIGKVRHRLQKDNNHSDIIYLVKLSDVRLHQRKDPELPENTYPRTVNYLINAKTGEIKEEHLTLCYMREVGLDGKLQEVKTKSFDAIPYGREDLQSPQKEKQLYAELEKESFARVLNYGSMDSDGRLVLENEVCKVHYNKTSQANRKAKKGRRRLSDRPVWTTKVEPMKSGSFDFKPGQDEYDAVIIFMAINLQIEYLKERGLKMPKKPIMVFVHDESVRDNAYFDPDKLEIHIGVGSGGNWGLFKKIVFDLGVTWHEAGHWVVYLQTPGNDLPGDEGGAMHESTGDMLDIIMDFLYQAWFLEKATGKKFTKDTIRNYHWIIGYYCLAPNGIRNQREPKKVYPKDMENEVHNDGLISGQACVQILLNILDASGDNVSALDVIDIFTRIYLGALAIVPADKVKFVDMLRAMITADKEIFGGANRAHIENGWKDHGVVLESARRKLAA